MLALQVGVNPISDGAARGVSMLFQSDAIEAGFVRDLSGLFLGR